MVAVPADKPYTLPEASTVATDDEVLHEPPEVASDSVIEEPVQTEVAPVIVPAEPPAPTVTVVVVLAAPQLVDIA